MKGFSEQEKKLFSQRLQEKGREFFASYGLKKTSVEDLTKAVGIAKGSFYMFFPSKEDLFLQVLENESEVVRVKLAESLRAQSNHPGSMIESFLLLSLKEIEENPIFKKILIREELNLIYRKLTLEQIENHRQKSMESLYAFVKTFQEAGILKEGEPEIIAGAMRALFFLPLHKDEIGQDIFPKVISLLVKLVSDGLQK